MNLTEELVRLVEAVVEKKISGGILKVRGITSAGDLSITSMGDIRIQAGIGKKVFINGIGFAIGDNGELKIYTKGGIQEVPM